jgi:hypothetical protein
MKLYAALYLKPAGNPNLFPIVFHSVPVDEMFVEYCIRLVSACKSLRGERNISGPRDVAQLARL